MQVAQRAADGVAAATMHKRGGRSIRWIRDLDRETAAIVTNDLESPLKRGFYVCHADVDQHAIMEAR